MARLLDDLLLQARELGIAHLDPEVPPGHHHRIACPDHIGQIPDRLGAFDLGHHQRVAAGRTQQRTRLVHVGGIAGEGNRQVVDLERRRDANVLAVLVGQRTGRQAPALAIDALVVAEFAADQYPGLDPRAVDAEHLQADLAVVEQQHVADEQVRGQLLVGNADRMPGAGVDGEARVQRELGAVGEIRLARRESVDADLGTLKVAEHAHVAAGLLRGFPHQIETSRMIGEGAVRKVQPHHVDAGAHHVEQYFGIIRGRTKSRDDLGPALNEAHAARCSRISTAGSFFPSTNSKNAPPPVDM